MAEIIKKIKKHWGRLSYSSKIILQICEIYGLIKTIKLFISNTEDKIVKVKGLKIAIRNRDLKSKLVDMCVILESLFDNCYIPNRNFNVKENDVIIDIGSHIGLFSIPSAKNAKNGIVYSFEPAPDSYSQFVKNIKINNITNIKAINKAVALKNGTCVFYLNQLNNGENSLTLKSKNQIIVETISLQNIFRLYKIKKCNILKIDCEGGEYDILFNTDKKLFDKIERIAGEYHDAYYYGIKNKEYTIENLKKQLEDNKFRVTVKRMNDYRGMFYAEKAPNR